MNSPLQVVLGPGGGGAQPLRKRTVLGGVTGEKTTPRTHAVILHADIAGSTRLVQLDASLAHQRITDAFKRLSATIREYGGVVHEIRGDALLAEFSRASDAASTALIFQQANAEHNAQFGGNIAPTVRIGISLGEVVIADKTITGPGVVLAQRLEQLAEPGGVCIQQAVYEALPRRLPFDCRPMGEQQLKGFDEPVRAYAVTVKTDAEIPSPASRASPSHHKGVIAAIVAVALFIGGALAWWQPWKPESKPASITKMAQPLPDKPSVAVVPFDNLSGDPEQEYLADGLTENIIMALSRIPDFFVIARNSTFVYKGSPVTVQEVAESLGVQHVVEGSFQRSDSRIRIHAQLTDALTGRHVWANTYDRPVADLFALQVEVIESIASALSLNLTEQQKAILASRYTRSIAAYELFLRAQALFFQSRADANLQAQKLFQRAIALDPEFARAYGALALTYAYAASLGWSESPDLTLNRGLELATRGLEIDPTLPQLNQALGTIHLFAGRYEKAIKAAEFAVTLDQNYADGYVLLGASHLYAGHPVDGIELFNRALRLNPYPPSLYYFQLGRALYVLERYAEAVTVLRKAVELNPNYLTAHLYLAAALAMLGEGEDAEWEKDKILAIEPGFGIAAWLVNDRAALPVEMFHQLFETGLKKAGLPE